VIEQGTDLERSPVSLHFELARLLVEVAIDEARSFHGQRDVAARY
jgi:hypothetical protein